MECKGKNMKQNNVLITVTAISLLFTSLVNAGSSDDPAGLKKLRKECHKKAMKEIEPINDYYRGKLKEKLKSAKKFNKADEVMAIEKELVLLKRDRGYLLMEQNEGVAQFEGTWEVEMAIGIYHTLVITKDGHVTSKDAGRTNGDSWNWGNAANRTIVYDKENEVFVVEWAGSGAGESLEIVGENRMKVRFWDGGDLPDFKNSAHGKGKRID